HFHLFFSLRLYNTQEYYERLQIFTENKRRIDKHNEGNHSFTSRSSLDLHLHALNQFSDMTFGSSLQFFIWQSYFKYCLLQNCSATKGNYISSNGPHPVSIDWRKKGNYVTDVKNQCFSCPPLWPFTRNNKS
uniref:Cathepsin propeptide inhibitor domain-containing protein n=1 Tax=Amphiprion ocellaris TaxID=80972 RepID=A0AAQ5YJJ4_AMPOC